MIKDTQRDLFRSAPKALISVFSVALISCVLIGMAMGELISHASRGPALTAGLIGLVFYLYRSWHAKREYSRRLDDMTQAIEQRLLASISSMYREARDWP